jgi:hypothetical protein
MTTWDDAHQAATAALAKSKWNKAVGVLAPWLTAIAPELDAKSWGDVVSMLGTAMTRLDDSVASVAAAAAAAPDDGPALHAFGHALVGGRRPDLAVAILARSFARSPTPAHLAELQK